MESLEKAIRVYDFSSKPPVLRSFAAGQIKLSDGATRNHREALTICSTDELTAILDFLGQALAR